MPDVHGAPAWLQLALSHMAEGSSIINCASIQGYSPTPGVLDYATTKVRDWGCLLLSSPQSTAALRSTLAPPTENPAMADVCPLVRSTTAAHAPMCKGVSCEAYFSSAEKTAQHNCPCPAGSDCGHDEGHVHDAGGEARHPSERCGARPHLVRCSLAQRFRSRALADCEDLLLRCT